MADNMFKNLYRYIILTFEIIKLNILSAMEYRATFITQVVGMALNDILLVFMWTAFFAKFPNLNGWGVQDTFLLFAIGMTNFGIYRIFAGNAEEISYLIARGELDYHLTLPKNVLWQVSTAKTNISAIGDVIFGVVLFLFIVTSWQQFILFAFISILTALILYNFIVLLQSMGFFFGNFEETADRIFHILLGLSLYPSTSFSGVLKFITFTIIPVVFTAWLPVDVVKNFKLVYIWYIIGFWLISLIITLFVFNRGLRRYESGNMIHVKM